jgi:hypothetical protein
MTTSRLLQVMLVNVTTLSLYLNQIQTKRGSFSEKENDQSEPVGLASNLAQALALKILEQKED